MFIRSLLFIITIFSIFLVSPACKTKQKQTNQVAVNEDTTAVAPSPEEEIIEEEELPPITVNINVPPADPGPGECLMKAKVLRILDTKLPGRSKCDRIKCQAEIQILTFLACGAGINAPPAPPTNTIITTFAYGVEPSSKNFPEVQPALPGIKEGQVFTTKVRGMGPDNFGIKEISIGSYNIVGE